MEIARKAIAKTEELVTIPSPAGYTYQLRKIVAQEMKDLGLEIVSTKKGGVYAILPGKINDQARIATAHIDTLGAMVSQILDNGRLRLQAIGGVSWAGLEGENVTVHGRDRDYSGSILPDKASVHIFSDDARFLKRDRDSIHVRLDEVTSSKEETQALGIRVGDFVSFEPRFVHCDSGYVKSRFLDDIACLGILIETVRDILQQGLEVAYKTYLFFSDYEETGHGLYGYPSDAFEVLALDIGTVGEGQTSDEHKVTILAKDSRTPYDYRLRRKLEDLAEENNIPYVTDVHNSYGSDASCHMRQGGDLNFACIGLGVDATHHYERTHINGYKANIDLLRAYLLAE